jgi:gliding motility-associated-like protein
MKKIILLLFVFLYCFTFSSAQTFSNSISEAAGSWNGTLTKTVNVSGISNLNSGIFELVQVNLSMGDNANTRNYNTYRITLTKGTATIDLVAVGGLPNSTIKQINTKFRFNPYLRRLFEHGGTAEPFSIGYYRSQDDFTAFNGIDPNGTWTITITETSFATGGRFNNVDLVFKTPYTVQDYTTLNSYDNCATPYCLGTAEIIVASNNGFTNQTSDMYNPNTAGCSWNAAQNNSAWFKFRAAQANASITISGITNNIQILGIDAGPDDNPCTNNDNTVLNGGCPTLATNDTYATPQYTNGSTKNNQLNLSGLTPGKYYYFIVDGTSSAVSPFYIETLGASLDCSNCNLNPTVTSNSPVCENSTLNLTCSEGVSWEWSGPNGFSSTEQNPTIPNVSLLANGTYTVTITDANNCTETRTVDVQISVIVTPLFNASSPVCSGTTINALPTTSNNGIEGTWSPALNNTATTTYTFAPNTGQCATNATITIQINDCDFGAYASAVWMDDCFTPGDGKFYNTTGSGVDLINQEPGNTFAQNFGVHIQNSSTLIMRGSEVKTYKNGNTNVCGVTLYYRYYLNSATGGSFTGRNLGFFSDCNTGTNEFSVGGGPCVAGQQKWQCVSQPSCDSPINLTNVPPGDYTLEVYYEISGDFNSTSQCDDTILLNNGGTNYKAFFSIIPLPQVTGSNPTICNVPNGSITLAGLTLNETYTIQYTFGTTTVGPINYLSNEEGSIVIPNLGIGTYSNFSIEINNCTTVLPDVVTLQNPISTPLFSTPNPICNGASIDATVFPTVSNNGISGVWSPEFTNTVTTVYTFTPLANQCANTTTLTLVVNPAITANTNTSPNTVCDTPTSTSCNGTATVTITQGSGNYSYLWNDPLAQTTSTAINLCAGNYCASVTDLDTNCTQEFCVTVNDDIPLVIPTFGFGNNISICAGSTVPNLPATSANGIQGTWSPSVVDNTANGTYTFTPEANQCATTTTFTATVTPQTTPTFSFGNNLSICAGAAVPNLTATSANGIQGTWNPTTIDNTANGTYTFTPNANQCATAFAYSVSITPGVIPTFGFGNNLSICAGSAVPNLPTTSTNGIQGTWSPSVVDNTANGTYTFTPNSSGSSGPNLVVNGDFSQGNSSFSTDYQFITNAGQSGVQRAYGIVTSANSWFQFFQPCESNAPSGGNMMVVDGSTSNAGNDKVWGQTVAVLPNKTYTFSYWLQTIATPNQALIEIKINGTTLGTALAPNTNCQTTQYTYQWNSGSNTTAQIEIFDRIFAANGNDFSLDDISLVDNSPQCTTATTLTVTITPQTIPTFSFGTSLTYCQGGVSLQPLLPTLSNNSISGTWNPSTIDNSLLGQTIYTFTPNAGQCATSATLTVTITPQITPTFSFGNNLTICAGATAPSLPATSTNGIQGTWNPAVVDNTSNGTYTFTPDANQCATAFTYSVSVTPEVIPTFNFGTSLTVCEGVSTQVLLPSLSNNSISGTWDPSTIDASILGQTIYTFTPDNGQCARNSTFTVTVNPIPQFTISGGCDGNDYVLEIVEENQNINTVEWYYNNNLIGQGNSIVISGEGLYTAVATNALNCDNRAQFDVTNDFCTIPKGVSANNDGDNDNFDLTNLNVERLQIFNRWGMVVYELKNYTDQWDGRSSDGTELPDGTYFYSIEQRSGKKHTGWVYLIREY